MKIVKVILIVLLWFISVILMSSILSDKLSPVWYLFEFVLLWLGVGIAYWCLSDLTKDSKKDNDEDYSNNERNA